MQTAVPLLFPKDIIYEVSNAVWKDEKRTAEAVPESKYFPYYIVTAIAIYGLTAKRLNSATEIV